MINVSIIPPVKLNIITPKFVSEFFMFEFTIIYNTTLASPRDVITGAINTGKGVFKLIILRDK